MNFANIELIMITTLLFQQFELKLVTQDPQIQHGLGANRPEKAVERYRRRPVAQGAPAMDRAESLHTEGQGTVNGNAHVPA